MKNSKINYEALFFFLFESLSFISLSFFLSPTHFTSNTCFPQISSSNNYVTFRDATFSTQGCFKGEFPTKDRVGPARSQYDTHKNDLNADLHCGLLIRPFGGAYGR